MPTSNLNWKSRRGKSQPSTPRLAYYHGGDYPYGVKTVSAQFQAATKTTIDSLWPIWSSTRMMFVLEPVLLKSWVTRPHVSYLNSRKKSKRVLRSKNICFMVIKSQVMVFDLIRSLWTECYRQRATRDTSRPSSPFWMGTKSATCQNKPSQLIQWFKYSILQNGRL